MQWRSDKKRFAQQEYWSAADGKVSKSFSKIFIDPLSDETYSLGFIYVESKNMDLIGGFPGSILLYAVRPFDPDMGCTGKLQGILPATGPPKVSTTELDGHPFAVIEEPFGKRRRVIWTDPAMDFAITRYVVSSDGREVHRCEVTLGNDPIVGSIPKSWRSQNWELGSNGAFRLQSTDFAQIVKYEINSKVEAADFNPQFPAGTVVTDRRSKTEYLVKNDGTKRQIVPAEREREATYAEIASTETGQAALYGSSSWILSYWLLGAGVIIAFVPFALWIRRRV
jgi:hypothetical protein